MIGQGVYRGPVRLRRDRFPHTNITKVRVETQIFDGRKSGYLWIYPEVGSDAALNRGVSTLSTYMLVLAELL